MTQLDPLPATGEPAVSVAEGPTLREADIEPADPALLSDTIGAERTTGLQTAALDLRERLAGRRIVDVNSTLTGGGVAEMLYRLLRYNRGAGIDARWFTIEADPEYFALTKRLHHLLHGADAPGPALDREAITHYAAIGELNARALLRSVRSGDLVTLHDPQTAGLTAPLREAGVRVVWRCHIGTDAHNRHTDQAWAFLRPFLEPADAYVFSRAQYVPEWLGDRQVAVIQPSIDPLSAKNRPVDTDTAAAIVSRIGLRAPVDGHHPAVYRRGDGSSGAILQGPTILHSEGPPPVDAPLVVQVSRWDPLKDMAGVLNSFADANGLLDGAHLALVGPDVTGVSDDPEGARVFEQCAGLWHALPERIRTRVHLACLALDDPEENAVIVNALQRQASVITQKSLAEGFGLTVTEAMWKGRPVVASAVGGIRDQIEHGVHGILLDDPNDRADFAVQTGCLVHDAERAGALGVEARRRAHEYFLDDRQLLQQAAFQRYIAAL